MDGERVEDGTGEAGNPAIGRSVAPVRPVAAVPDRVGGDLPAPAPTAGAPIVAKCPRCGAEHDRKAVFCGSCRSFLEAPDVGKLASAKRRLGAAMLDSVFQDGGVIGSILGPLLIGSGPAHGVVALLSTVYWVLTLYLWSKGTTPAKRALDMDVIRSDGEPAGFWRMAFRETIGKWISTVALGLGLLSVPLDRNRQGWHDKMADTYVVFDDEK